MEQKVSRRLARTHGDIKAQRARYDERYPLKSPAHRAVYWAIKRGELSKGPCYFCAAKKAEAHHEDYSKPLDVIWMCRPCHKKYHALVGVF